MSTVWAFWEIKFSSVQNISCLNEKSFNTKFQLLMKLLDAKRWKKPYHSHLSRGGVCWMDKKVSNSVKFTVSSELYTVLKINSIQSRRIAQFATQESPPVKNIN